MPSVFTAVVPRPINRRLIKKTARTLFVTRFFRTITSDSRQLLLLPAESKINEEKDEEEEEFGKLPLLLLLLHRVLLASGEVTRGDTKKKNKKLKKNFA